MIRRRRFALGSRWTPTARLLAAGLALALVGCGDPPDAETEIETEEAAPAGAEAVAVQSPAGEPAVRAAEARIDGGSFEVSVEGGLETSWSGRSAAVRVPMGDRHHVMLSLPAEDGSSLSIMMDLGPTEPAVATGSYPIRAAEEEGVPPGATSATLVILTDDGLATGEGTGGEVVVTRTDESGMAGRFDFPVTLLLPAGPGGPESAEGRVTGSFDMPWDQ